MKLFSRNIAAFFALTLALSGTGFCQEAARERVAVLPFTLQSVSPEEGVQLSQRFTAVVAESKRFSVLPAATLQKVLEEHKHKSNDSCDSPLCLGQLGRELGVEKIVHVRVVHREGLYVLFIRLVNVEGASLLYSERIDYHGEFDALLSEVIPEQALKLAKAHLDANTPWVPAMILFAACLGTTFWIYAHFRRGRARHKSPEAPTPAKSE